MHGAPLHINLLVVDDDDVDRERVLRLLARTRLEVDAMQASSSAGALKLLREYEFDCIVLDNQLGDALGAELLPTIHRESRRDCPVIMITGAGSEALAVQALHDGAADYLSKYQLSAETLSRAIRRALEHHQMRRELDELHLRLEQRVEEQAAAIRQSERDLRAILDHTPSVIAYWDAQLQNRFGNRAHREWLGVDPETLPGQHLREVIGAEWFAHNQARIDGVLRGQSQSFEQDMPAPDGALRRHTQLSFHPDIGDDGGVRGFYSTATDITAIKQAQARAEESAAFARAVFESSPVGLAVFDGDGLCVMCNQACAALFGGEAESLRGRSLEALFAEGAPTLTAAAQATLADGLARRVEIDLQTVFGRHLLAAGALVRVDREGRAHLLLAAQDSAEQRHAHDALVAARNAAEDAARTKSGFLANMSHEIRTPMNAIVGLTRLALEDALPPVARDYLDKVHNSAQALMGILDDVLDYSKIEAGQLRFERLPFDLEQTLQRVVDLFAARIDQKGLEFIVDLAPDLPPRLVGDSLRLSQVLNNLVGNAVKFTEHGHIHLSVQRLDAGESGAAMLRFSVRDSGIGIEPARLTALFEAFAQGDSSITRRFGGTGLGLAICRRLVAMMDGSIGVDSEPGQGSEFWFTARLDPADGPGAGARLQDVAGLQVLIVEHSDAVARVLGEQLQAWQVQSRRAADLDAALEALALARIEGRAIDAVLLDWHLPGAGGPAALRSLHDATGDGRALFVLAMINAIGRASQAGFGADIAPDVVLGKPVLASPLLDGLLQLRARHRSGGPSVRASAPHAPAIAANRLGERARPLLGAHVLLVEDNELNQLVAQRFLQRMGIHVELAAHGAQALEMLRSGKAFDAVLMDLHMPVMDGLEATRRIRAQPAFAGLPVIGMTAAAMADDRARCFAAGMVEHVPKPIVPEQLLDALLHWIGHRTGQPRQPVAEPAVSVEPTAQQFDLSMLEVLVHGDRSLMWNLLRTFAQHEASTAAEIAAQIAAGDTVAASRKLHHLRGGAGTLGAKALAQAALVLEKALRAGSPVEPPLAAFTQTLQATLAQLQEMLPPAS